MGVAWCDHGMSVLTRSIDVIAPIQIAFNRIARLENFASFLPSSMQVAPLPPGGLIVHDLNSGARFEVQLYERIPYTQIAWRCSETQHCGRLRLSLMREMPDKACRISFELEYVPELLSEEGHRSLGQQIGISLQRLKHFLENREGQSAESL